MAAQDPSKTTTPSGPVIVLVAAIGLLLFFGAVVLGWKLSHPKPDAGPTVESASPEPVAPPEKSAVTDAERKEVLERIDLMPNVTAEVKERLYAYVERAQGLQRLLTVTFETNRTKVSEKEATRVVRLTKETPFADVARDPSTIFVVLGYADQSADEKKNLQTSLARTTSVLDLLQKRCGVMNVIHPVPMGNPKLFHPKDPSENRVAEIWAVKP